MCATGARWILFLPGDVIETERDIIVEDVPIITPNGDVVANKLNIKVFHLLACCPGISCFTLADVYEPCNSILPRGMLREEVLQIFLLGRSWAQGAVVQWL